MKLKQWYEAYKAGWFPIFVKNFPHITADLRRGIFVFWKTGHALHLSNPYGLPAEQLNKRANISLKTKTY